MDYAVYKKVGGMKETAARVFTQEKCDHKAKKAAQDYIKRLFFHAGNLQYIHDIKAGDGLNSFEYDLMKSTTEQVHIRFYVGTYNQKQVKPA